LSIDLPGCRKGPVGIAMEEMLRRSKRRACNNSMSETLDIRNEYFGSVIDTGVAYGVGNDKGVVLRMFVSKV
jgi:hypothetical protein